MFAIDLKQKRSSFPFEFTPSIKNYFEDEKGNELGEVYDYRYIEKFMDAIKSNKEHTDAFLKISAYHSFLSSALEDYKAVFEEPFENILQEIANNDLVKPEITIKAFPGFLKEMLSYTDQISPLLQSLLSYSGSKRLSLSKQPTTKNKTKVALKKK